MNTNQKMENLRKILKSYGKFALAFSGGADSTLLAYLAKDSECDVLGIIFDNSIFPSGFLEFAEKRASELGMKVEIIENDFYDTHMIVENTPKRCLVCRKLMYDAIKQLANDEGYEIIIDGNNITDLTHDRPGILMKYEYGIESPLIEAELETPEIRKFIEENNIEYSSSTTCLATRVKTNEKLSIDKINRIDYCESFIKEKLNSDALRLREEKNIATIEMENMESIIDKEKIDEIVKELKLSQYDKVLLNLEENSRKENLIEDNELQKGASNLSLRKKLPFGIDIVETGRILQDEVKNENDFIGNVETIAEIGYIKLNVNDKESKIFRDGHISIENLKNKKEAKEHLVKILPLIRRTVED